MAKITKGLSPRHKKILNFLEKTLANQGLPPTIREIGDNTQISSTSVVNYYLEQLEEAGYIERRAGVSRGITLIKNAAGKAIQDIGRAIENVVQTVMVPLVGNIVAGEPMPVPASDFSYYDPESGIDIARSLLPAHEAENQLYALRVHGDSMIDAMINDGDIVVMQQTNQAKNGDMVAIWLTDRDETTLKHFYFENGHVRLQPANPTMQAIIIDDPSIVKIQGKVVLVIRQLAEN